MSLLAGLRTSLMINCACIKTVYKLVLQDQISHRYSLKLQGFIKFFKIPKDSLDGKKTDSDTTKLNEKTSRMVFYVKPYGMRSFLFHKWHSYDITIFVTGRRLCLIACSSLTFMNF